MRYYWICIFCDQEKTSLMLYTYTKNVCKLGLMKYQCEHFGYRWPKRLKCQDHGEFYTNVGNKSKHSGRCAISSTSSDVLVRGEWNEEHNSDSPLVLLLFYIINRNKISWAVIGSESASLFYELWVLVREIYSIV